MISLTACTLAPIAPEVRVIEVTHVIPVTRIAPAQPVIITQVIPVTRVIPVIQVIQITRIVEIREMQPVATGAPTPAEFPSPPPAWPEAPTMVAPTAVMAPTEVPPTPRADIGLLVWYDFEGDFVNTGIVEDRSNNGNYASVAGSVATDQGIYGGQSIYFSGNSYIQAQGNPAGGRTQVSFSIWFKTDNPESNYKLASAAWWNGGPGSGWILATHIPEFWSDDTKGLYLPDLPNNDNDFVSGTWIHEVVTYDGSHIREYTNAQLINDWPTTGAAIGQGQPMAIGAWPMFGFNFRGSIDEFQIYGRCLTIQEIQAIYHQGR